MIHTRLISAKRTHHASSKLFLFGIFDNLRTREISALFWLDFFHRLLNSALEQKLRWIEIWIDS
jgi:hypothetical protein